MFESPQSIKLALVAVCLLVLVTLERRLPLQVSCDLAGAQKLKHMLRNLGLAGIAALLSGGLAILSLLQVLLHNETWQYGVLYLLDIPVWLQGLIALVLFDIWQYAWHRLNHRVNFLWRFHTVHHADSEMDASTGLRFHFVELMLSALARIPIVLLIGMQLQHLVIYELIALPVILFHHANVRTNVVFDRIFRRVLVSPRMHRVHHRVEFEYCNSNYSSVLSIWDRLFGTYREPVDSESARLGVPGAAMPRLKDMLLRPFRRSD